MSKAQTKEKTMKAKTSPNRPVRRLRPPKRSWRKPRTWFVRQIQRSGTLPTVRSLCKSSWKLLHESKRQVVMIYCVYLVGSLVFAKGVASATDLNSIQSLIDGIVSGMGAKLQTASLQLTYLYTNTGSSDNNANAGIYQSLLLLVGSLAIIWLFRQTLSGNRVTTKQAFYRGMYPIIPMVLVLIIIGLQLVPFMVGSYIFTTLVGGGIAVGPLEQIVAFIVFAVLTFWSLRMVIASIFAMYIVTLPDMQPFESIRSAKRLVVERRLVVLRKLLPMPIILFVATSLIIIPCLLVSSALAVWVFFAVSGTWFIIAHAYLYTLYRELLNNE